jgi:hypothetical protein
VRAGPKAAGRLVASFGIEQEMAVLPDLGSDENVLPQSLINSLEAAGMFVPVRSLPTPVKLELEVQGPGRSTIVRRQAQLSIELYIPAGPLRIRNTQWLICEDSMDEVLLGRPVLHTLGINAEAHLMSARDSLQDFDCSNVPSIAEVGRLSRLLIKRADPKPSVPPSTGGASAQPPSMSTLASTKVCYGDTDTDPVVDPCLLDFSSSHTDATVAASMNAMVDAALSEGMSEPAHQQLRPLVFEFTDIWRIGLSPGPPAKLPPMHISLRPGANPVRVRVRKYPQEQREFLSRFVTELVANGHAVRNPHATWCAAPLLVPKEGPSQFRFTVDLRPFNKATIPSSWPIPHLESELGRVAGSHFFSTFDLSNGYWQLELHEDSPDCQSFITPDGVYKPTRVLHGSSNAVAHRHLSLQGVLGDLSQFILAWLDDLTLHAPTEADFLARLRKLFMLCRDFNLKLHPGSAPYSPSKPTGVAES